ncbi:MAG TPA: carboxypeptidase-like regulatory domain-containing protein [Gemmatimonadales bacterium]|jgi:hypothetical protein
MRGWLLAVGILPASLAAQVDTTAAISGRAISAYNGKSLVGVMIALPSAHKFSVSDSNGVFRLAGLPTGQQKVRVAYEGRETAEYEFGLKSHRTKRLTVVLDVDAVDLAPVVVTTRFPDADWRDLGGFYARRRMYGGWGRFYTREDIERWHVISLESLLAREGIMTRCMGSCLPTRFGIDGVCTVAVSVDGMPFWDYDYANIPIDEVAGVEVYRNDTFTPLELQSTLRRVDLTSGRRNCGAVQIWTR